MTTTTRRLTTPAAPLGRAENAESDWRNQSACRGAGNDSFFPVGSGPDVQVMISQAKQVCARCPVIEQCLRFALETRQEAGVWGGLSEQERAKLQRRRKRMVPTPEEKEAARHAREAAQEEEARQLAAARSEDLLRLWGTHEDLRRVARRVQRSYPVTRLALRMVGVPVPDPQPGSRRFPGVRPELERVLAHRDLIVQRLGEGVTQRALADELRTSRDTMLDAVRIVREERDRERAAVATRGDMEAAA